MYLNKYKGKDAVADEIRFIVVITTDLGYDGAWN